MSPAEALQLAVEPQDPPAPAVDSAPPRPRTRGDCADGVRPCPWISCKYHLFLDVDPETGKVKLNFPGVELEDMRESCALDVADRGNRRPDDQAGTLDEIAEFMGVTRERIRQIQVGAMRKSRALLEGGELDLSEPQRPRTKGPCRPPHGARAGLDPPPSPRARGASNGQAPAAPAKRNGVVRGGLPLAPESPVRCDHFDATVPLKVCLERQHALWPGGNRWKGGDVRAKKAAIHEWCGSGLCAQGAEYERRTSYDPEAEWSKGRYRFYRPDSSAQRKRRRQIIRENLDLVPTIDSSPGTGEGNLPLDLAMPDVRELVDAEPLGLQDANAL